MCTKSLEKNEVTTVAVPASDALEPEQNAICRDLKSIPSFLCAVELKGKKVSAKRLLPKQKQTKKPANR